MQKTFVRHIKFDDDDSEATGISTEMSMIHEVSTASAPGILVTTVMEQMQEADTGSTSTSSSSTFPPSIEPFMDPSEMYDIEKLLEVLNKAEEKEIVEEKEKIFIDFDVEDELEVESTESESSLQGYHSSWEPEMKMGEEEYQSLEDEEDTSTETESYDPEWEAYVAKASKERMSEVRRSMLTSFDRASLKKEAAEPGEAGELAFAESTIDPQVQAKLDATNIVTDFLNDLIRIVCHSSDALKELNQIGSLLDKPKIFIELSQKKKYLHELQLVLAKMNHQVADHYRGKMKKQVFKVESNAEKIFYYARLLENMKRLDYFLHKRFKLQSVLPSKYQHLEKEKKQMEDDLQLKRDELYNMMHRLLKTKKRPMLRKDVETFIKKMESNNNEVSAMRKIFIEKQDMLGNYEIKLKNVKNIEGLDIDHYINVKFIINSLQKRKTEREDAILRSIFEYNSNLNIMAHVDEYIEVLRAKTKILKESEAMLIPIIYELRPVLAKYRTMATKIKRARIRYFNENIFHDPHQNQHYAEVDMRVRNLMKSNEALRKELETLQDLYKKLEVKCKKKENRSMDYKNLLCNQLLVHAKFQ